MSKLGVVLSVVGVLLGLAAVIVGALLYYYRPVIEYAYVDLRDGREYPISGWALLGGSLATLGLVAVPFVWLVRWWRRRNAAR
jgi:hypothetical protein